MTRAPAGVTALLRGPARPVPRREAIREYSRQVMALPLRIEEYEVTEHYRTQDPEVVVVEMRAKATVTATGRAVTAASIQVLRIREVRIAVFRDYADPRVFQDVMRDARGELSLLPRCRAARDEAQPPGVTGITGAGGRAGASYQVTTSVT